MGTARINSIDSIAWSINQSKKVPFIMIDLKSFISSYKSGGLKFVTFITDDNSMSELDSTKVLQINLHVIQQLLKMNSLVFLW